MREALTMFEELYRTVDIVGFELAEVNPELGASANEIARTATVSRHILACVFGSCYGRWP